MTDPRLAALLHERFHVSPWWTTPTYWDPSNTDVLTEISKRRRELIAAAGDEDTPTCVLPDPETKVA